MADDATTVKLNTGHSMPRIGLGTWKSAPGAVGGAVAHAVRNGYRHIDCAQVYGNEAEVGAALKALFDEGVVRRDELFVTSKVFNNYHDFRTPEQIAAGVKSFPEISLETSLRDLFPGDPAPYLDLLLVHWPIGFNVPDPLALPKQMRLPDGNPVAGLNAQIEFVQTWRTLEDVFLAGGRVRSIGVSNFTVPQLEALLAGARVVPAVNQFEGHPLLVQRELRAFCAARGIVVTTYSPLGSPDSYSGSLPGAPSLLRNEVVGAIATAHGVTPAQVLIRWSIQSGCVCIPKSVTPARIDQNLQVFGFALSDADMAALESLDCGHRFGKGWMTGHFL
eukprot:a677437_56.p1 GENE.a677437_56~~a677437_56.p1  ORF type:complete len:345 (-),score=97.48 a677437_56:167-1168(-)